MTARFLELSEDRIAAQDELSLPVPDGSRIVYVVEGEVEANGVAYGENSAFFDTDACTLQSSPGARLWRWELHRTPTPTHPSLKASHQVELDCAAAYLMRCDRVDFPPQGIAYTHVHAGPGIRILLQGTIRVQVEDRETAIAPGEAWFERGPDPVLALADEQAPTSFVRAALRILLALPLRRAGSTTTRSCALRKRVNCSASRRRGIRMGWIEWCAWRKYGEQLFWYDDFPHPNDPDTPRLEIDYIQIKELHYRTRGYDRCPLIGHRVDNPKYALRRHGHESNNDY